MRGELISRQMSFQIHTISVDLHTRKFTYILFLLPLPALLISCEGFKVLVIHNSSPNEAKVTIRPGQDYSDRKYIYDYPNKLTSDSSQVFLQPDSFLTILSIFTALGFNAKIKEEELRTDYLKIETKTDTVVAESRKEIIDLIYANRKSRIKGDGKNLVTLTIE